MARDLRLDFAGARHHVMNRGARREPVFLRDDDCRFFLAQLAELPTRFGLKVHAYALLPNHFHLLLESTRGQLSEGMSFLQSSYAHMLNTAHGWDGPVFKGRFRSRMVDDDAWWLHLLAYIHLNPVRSHLARSPETARWTSHEAYLRPEFCPPWLTTADLLADFGSRSALEAYVDDVRVGRETGPQGFDAKRLWGPKRASPPPPDEVLMARPRPLTLDEAWDAVTRVTGQPQAQLRQGRPGRNVDRARWVAAWWLVEATHLSQRAVAEALHMNPSTMSRAVMRIHGLRITEPQVSDWMDALDREPGARRG
jgi:putative transposase